MAKQYHYLLHFLCALCVLWGEFRAQGAVVVPVEGATFEGELVSIDGGEGQVTLRVVEGKATPDANAKDTASKSLMLDDLVRLGAPALPRPQTLLLLADGSRLVTAADWKGGAAARLEGDQVVVRSDVFREAHLPRTLVRGLVFANRSSVRDRQGLEKQLRAHEAVSDEILLSNGDRLTGKLTELAGGSVTLDTDSGPTKLLLSRVDAVLLGSRQLSVVSGQLSGEESSPWPSSETTGSDSKYVVGLRDGSLLYADGVRADKDSLAIEMADGVKLDGGVAEDVVLLQSLGGKFVYLSDLEPVDYRFVPYLSMEWPWERDRNVLGEILTTGGQRYLKGIGMHSAGRLTYRLEGKYRRFDAAVALDDSAGKRGSVTFGVYLLRDGKWKEAYVSDIVRGGDKLKDVSVDVSGADGMTLTVDYADRGDELDHADWLDARLIK